MDGSQRCIRVFLSSTFRDFSEERDLLVRQVFPALRAKLAERFVDLVDIDLRWGITEEEAERGEVLSICLAEIDRSRPFFIGLLGERYGWVPPSNAFPAEVLETQPWLHAHRGGKSVTELEILHGVLNNPEMAGRALFYFRSASYAQAQGEGYLSLTAEDQAKQQALKDRIRESDFPVVEDYETPQAVADRIQHALWEALDAEFPATDVPDAFTRDLLQHEAYAASRRRIYLRGGRYLDNLNQALQGAAQWILIEGESGSGKTALMANWVSHLTQASDDLVIHTHFLGANLSAADPEALVRRLIERIRRETDSDEEPASDPDALLDALPEWLARASAWAELNNRRFLIVLDSLNGLAGRRELRWFPSIMPPRVHCVVSTLPGEVREQLDKKANWHRIKVERLDHETTRQVFEAYLSLFNKRLPEQLIDQVMDHPLVTNPLFLLTLAEELRLFGDHEKLTEQLNYYQESETVDDLFERVLARIEDDHSGAVIRQIMTALWAARGGMREEELLAYTGLTPMKWAYIRHALGPALIETTGRYVFAHDYLRIAVSDRYMAGNNHLEDKGQSEQALALREKAHIRLAQWFEANSFQGDQSSVTPDRAAEEIPYQWQRARQWQRLTQSLTDLRLFNTHADHRDKAELLKYWLDVEAHTETTIEQAYEHAWVQQTPTDRIQASQLNLAKHLGGFLDYSGRYGEFTERLLRIVSRELEFIYGPHCESSISAKKALADLLIKREYSGEAEHLFRELLDAVSHVHGANSKNQSEIQQGLAQLDTLRPSERLSLLRHALKTIKVECGYYSVSTAHAIGNLGRNLWSLSIGDNNEAQALLEEAVKLHSDLLGTEHPSTSGAMSQLSIFLMDIKGDHARAETLLKLAYESQVKTLGSDHPKTSFTLENYAHLLDWTGQKEEAEKLYRRDASIVERRYGAGHTRYAQSLNSLATCLLDQNKYCEAEDLLKQSYNIVSKKLGKDHSWSLASRNTLAISYACRGELSSAEEIFQELSHADPDEENAIRPIERALKWYIDRLSCDGDLGLAKSTSYQLIRMERENLGTAHVDLSHTYYVLGGILDDLGENNEATECYEACLNIEIENWGNDDIDLIPTYNALGKSLYWQGEYAAAWKNFSSALALSSTDTTEHPDELDESRRYIATITSIQRTSD